VEELDGVLAESHEAPLILFKHSTRCPISTAANQRVEQFIGGGAETPVVMVKVVESRPLSNAIAEKLGVTHQSPQVILVKGGQAVWNASHHQIGPKELTEAIAERA
jgi:bacillithiol system protein YtxJ